MKCWIWPYFWPLFLYKSVSETPPIHYGPHDKVVELAEICRLRYSKWGHRWESFWDMGRSLKKFWKFLKFIIFENFWNAKFYKKNALTFYWGTFESSNYMESKEGVGIYLVWYSKIFGFEIFLWQKMPNKYKWSDF